MTDRPTPEQIIATHMDAKDVLMILAHHGYVIVNTDDMRHWWEDYDDAVDPYSLMNWMESQ